MTAQQSEAVSRLKDCGFEYGQQRAILRRAVDCGAPLDAIEGLQKNLASALEELTDAARAYYDGTYEGAPTS